MNTLREQVYRFTRALGRWWAAPQRGWARNLTRKTLVLAVAIFMLYLVGEFALVSLNGLALAFTGEHWWADLLNGIALFVFLSSWTAFCILLFLSRRMFATAEMRHAASPDEVLATCANLLQDAGFAVSRDQGTRLRALRGDQRFVHMVEHEWRTAPLELNVEAVPDEGGCLLRVVCIGGGFGTASTFSSKPGLKFIDRTAGVVAALDKAALSALDGELVWRQGRNATGGVATSIRTAAVLSALLSTWTVGGMGLWICGNLLTTESEDRMLDHTDSTYASITTMLRGQLRTELEATLPRGGMTVDQALEAVGTMKFVGLPGQPVVVVRRTGSAPIVLLPKEGDPQRGAITADALSSGVSLTKAGDRVLYMEPWAMRGNLRRRLSLPKDISIDVGALLPVEHLATVVSPTWPFAEMRLFHRGRAYAQLRFDRDGKTVALDEKSIPSDKAQVPPVVALAFRKASLDWDVLIQRGIGRWDEFKRESGLDGVPELFFPGQRPELQESADGYQEVYRLSYNKNTGALNGYAATLEFRPGRWRLWGSIVFLAAVLFYVPLFLPSIWARRIGRGISEPILEVRDAMRAIAGGDYSVRVRETRADEVGQLQRLLNFTAAELHRRESIKELMGKYLSKQVADRIMESDTAGTLTGTRKEVSILFADVRGFTAFSEKRDPEHVTKSLNEYFEVMVDVIASHEGVLDKFIGDGLMVVFGAPVTQDDHAWRAVATALEMQAALQSLNLKRAQKGEEPIAIGVGVNTGLAISGNLGSIKRMEFTVIGDTVNTAARLESRAAKGQVLIGRRTYELVREMVDAESLGEVTVKGKSEPIEVWNLKGLKPVRN